MLLKFQLFLIFQIISLHCYAYANKFNVSLTNLATCEQYTIKSGGYTYADFFQLHDMKNKKVLKDNERLHLKFYVATSMDAHILLSEVNNPRRTDRVYEIVLGAGTNSYSAIRLMISRNRVATNFVSGLLSVIDPMPVEIIQNNDGLLVVNIPGYSESHLNYMDESPLNIRYVSFSSYGSIPAKWYYDCKFDGFSDEMEMEVRPLTAEERLTADLLNKSRTDMTPENEANISFAFKVRSVEFDQRSSILSTRLHIMMEWVNERLKWNPDEYEGVNYVVHPLFNLWHPELVIKDGALDTFKKFKPFFSIRVESSGRVKMFARNAELHTWCFDIAPNWPNDATKCEIILGTKNENIKLLYNTSSPFTDQNINELSEWSIDKVTVKFGTYEKQTNETSGAETKEDLLELVAGDLKIQIQISRNSAYYQCIFKAPAAAARILIILAFFLKKYKRGGFYLIALVVLSIALMFAGKHAPAMIMPNIVKVYKMLMVSTTICYILHVVSIWLEEYPPKVKPHHCLVSIINCSALRFVLGLRFEDSTAMVAAQEYPWNEISKILNRLFLLGIAITFISIDCLY